MPGRIDRAHSAPTGARVRSKTQSKKRRRGGGEGGGQCTKPRTRTPEGGRLRAMAAECSAHHSSLATGVPCTVPRKSRKICTSGLRTTFAITLSRPRCGIPITMYSTCASPARSTSPLSPTINDSQPSRPNRFVRRKLVPQKRAKESAQQRCWSARRRSALLGTGGAIVSSRSRSQSRRRWLRICMYSTPTEPVYTSRRRSCSRRRGRLRSEELKPRA
jgi:hypothetical protein